MVIALTTTTISAPRTTFMVAPPPSLRIHVGWPESTADVTLRPLGVGGKNHNVTKRTHVGNSSWNHLCPQQPAAESAPPES